MAMAEAPRNRLPSGYDEDFVNAVDDENLGLICHLPLKEPVLTRCGHRFCKECLEEHFRRQEAQDQPITCPADRENLDRDRDVFPDKATERIILSFAIKCPSEGCDWTGELRSKEAHLASCLFRLVHCTNENCHVTMQRRHLEEHVTINCSWRILACDHCSEPHPQCKMKDHNEQCSKFPVTCPNGCEAIICRETVPNHTKDNCPLTIMPCPYEKMGCKTKVQRREVESHLQSAMRPHLDLACLKLNNTEVKLNDMQETTRKLVEKIDKLEQKISEGEGNEPETEKMAMKPELSDLPRVIVWKIINFSEIFRQAKTGETRKVDGVPFYTESYGYKLKVRIYPNGYGTSTNTDLSVFIVVMKGEYDAILPWPFKKKIKMTLIDQQEDSAERENVTDFIKGINPGYSTALRRPIHGNENRGIGIVQFISHRILSSRRYLVDDTLFLQVEVDPETTLSLEAQVK